MESQTVTYDDVADIFRDGGLWCNGYEQYWYRFAWSLLEKEGLTAYTQPTSEYKIYLYALTLVFCYYGFCEAAFQESNEISLSEHIEDFVPDVIIGQLVAEYLSPDDCVDDAEAALQILVNEYKFIVFQTIKHQISECVIFLWMYCSANTLNHFVIDEDGEEDEVPYEIECMEDYEKMLAEVADDILNDIDGDLLSGFDFVCCLC